MRTLVLPVTLMSIFCALFTATSSADTLIYNNASLEGYFVPGSNIEIFDYGTSPGGLVSKLVFGYRSTSVTPTVWVRFYRSISTTYYDTGILVKQLIISNLPSTGGSTQYFTYVLPEADRFTLPAGTFGYSLTCSSSTMQLAVASGGAGNVNEMWEYDYDWMYGWGWYPFWFGGYPWAGLYMQLYTAPPIDEVTCDIGGAKFNDLNGNGIWEAGEPNLPGWELYIDLNHDGVYQVAEPNVVTDPNGIYLFENLDAPATYTIREIMKNGWNQTLPGASQGYQYVLSVDPNTLYTGFDFGNTTQPLFTATITGKKFHDLNGNSALDPGEPGLSSKRIYIDANGNDTYDAGEISAQTNASGDYQLIVNAAGTFTVAEEILPDSGWVQTYPTAACTHAVTINTADQVVSGIHFGNFTFNNYGGGSGTPADPYRISSHLHLQALGAHKWDWNKHFKLTANIMLTKYKNEQFNLIGRYNFFDQLTPFSGTFDGDGFYIGRFSYTYKGTRQESIGLFGYVHGTGAQIRNLKLYDTTVDTQGSGTDSGALIGWLRSGTVTHCYVGKGSIRTQHFSAGGMIGDCEDGTVTDCHARIDVESPNGVSGGLVGYVTNGTLTDCSAEGTVIGHLGVGGLAGINNGQIQRCYADADVTGFQYTGGLVGENYGSVAASYSRGSVWTVDDTEIGLGGSQAGGLVGRNISGGAISDSWSASAVTGGSTVGGLVGVSWGSTATCYVTNCYSAGPVAGISGVGGLIGSNTNSIVTGCVWDKQTSGRTTSSAGTGKTTWQMQNEGTYAFLGWDLTTPVWNLCPAAGYPALAWQNYSTGPGGGTLKWTARESWHLGSSGEKVLVDGAGNVIVGSRSMVEHAVETNYDYAVSKYTPAGTQLWARTYDSDPAGDVTDTLIDMALDAAGNIYLTGIANQNILTVKYNPQGTRLWERVFNGPDSNHDEAIAIAVDSAGNVYVAGETYTYARENDFCLIKYNTNGVFQWSKLYDGGDEEHDYLTGLALDSIGNIVITGEAGTTDNSLKVLVLKYNPAGTLLWPAVYASPADTFVYPEGIKIDADDNICIVGTFYNTTDEDLIVLKYDSSGTLLWPAPAVFDLDGDDQSFPSLAIDQAGSIYLSGIHDSAATGEDYLLVKFSPDGVLQWHRTYNGPDNVEDDVLEIAVNAEQDVFLTGISDFYRVGYQIKGGHCTTQKYDTNGNLLWSADYDGYQDVLDMPMSITTSGSNVYVTGQFEGTWLLSNTRILCYTDCSWTGDADVDYRVTLGDFALVAGNWLETNCNECQKADWTGDGNVLMDDVAALAANWLNGI